MVGVGAVVMNRVKSGAYPNSIYGVIYASGQFTPAMSGKVARVYESGNVPEKCVQAATAALAGETTVGGATYFRRATGHAGYVLGDHVFW
jgi:spore germination cell wall hydrolase CwlJ-like protein